MPVETLHHRTLNYTAATLVFNIASRVFELR
jgi:hypothetical protein